MGVVTDVYLSLTHTHTHIHTLEFIYSFSRSSLMNSHVPGTMLDAEIIMGDR